MHHMYRVQGDGEPPVEGWHPSDSPADAPDPPTGSNNGVDPRRTKAVDANAAADTAAPAAAEQYPSYIRRKSTAGVVGGDGDGDDRERDTEKGYVGGDRVRLLVGR